MLYLIVPQLNHPLYHVQLNTYDIQQFSIELVAHCKGAETAPLRFNGVSDTRYSQVIGRGFEREIWIL